MKKNYAFENPVFRFMGKLFDTALLNLLWVLTSIPVVTMGASTAALYCSAYELATDRGNGVIKGYLKAWRKNFKTGTELFFSLHIPIMLLFADIFWLANIQEIISDGATCILTMISGTIMFLLILTAIYAIPLQSIFENSIAAYLINGMRLALLNVGRSLLIALFDLSYLGLTCLTLVYLPPAAILFLLLGVAFVARVNMALLLPIIKSYI